MNRRIFLYLGAALAVPAAAQTTLPSVSVREAHQRLTSGRSVLVDIRTPEEWTETGVAEGAVALDMLAPDFLLRLEALKKANAGKEIDLICHSAVRTAVVQRSLAKRGWQGIVNVRGGMAGRGPDAGWIESGLPVVRR